MKNGNRLIIANIIFKYKELEVYDKVTADQGVLWKSSSKFVMHFQAR